MFAVELGDRADAVIIPYLSAAVILVKITTRKASRLALRGRLVRVRCGTHQTAPEERWFAVGIYFQKMAEAAVCNLPQIESTNVVFARRPLKRAEIEMLRLRRGQVVECSVSNDTIQSVSPMAVVEQSIIPTNFRS